jgi:hypothetical protein
MDCLPNQVSLPRSFPCIFKIAAWWIVMFFIGCSPNNPLPQFEKPHPQSRNTLPAESLGFVLTESNNIALSATIDHKYPVRMMLHTGVDSVSLTKETTARLPELVFDKSDSVTSWGGTTTSMLSENHSLQLGNRDWERLTLGESDYSGKDTDGKFGLNLFAGNVVEIDFDTSNITLHESLPELASDYEKLDLVLKHGLIFLQGSLSVGSNQYDNEFMIHSGFGGTLLLDDQFVSDHQLSEQLATKSEQELKDSYGNIIRTRIVVVPAVRFGDSRFEDVPVGLFEASLGRQKMSVLGGGLLKRFNMILDLKSSKIYLKPNQHFAAAIP